MIRKSKTLGLTLIAALAMSALVVAAAHAAPHLRATVSPVGFHATGQNIEEQITIDGVTTTCEVSHYTGTATHGATSLTLTPSYTNCTFKGTGIAAEVTNDGCGYLLQLDSLPEVPYEASVDIECPAGKAITIISATCAASIGAQKGLSTVDVTNDAADLTIRPTLEGITAAVTADGFLCPFTGTGAKTGGKYFSKEGITTTPASGSLQISEA